MTKTGKYYLIDKIVNERIRKGQWEYLVKWKGYSANSNSWEPESCFKTITEKERKALEKTTIKRGCVKNRMSAANPRTTTQGCIKATLAVTSKAHAQSRTTAKINIDDGLVTETTKKAKPNSRPKKDIKYYAIERIFAKRIVNSKVEYLVHWKGYSRDDSTWEPENRLKRGYCETYCYSLRKAFLD